MQQTGRRVDKGMARYSRSRAVGTGATSLGAAWSRAALDAAIAFRNLKVAKAMPRRGGRRAAGIVQLVMAYYLG